MLLSDWYAEESFRFFLLLFYILVLFSGPILFLLALVLVVNNLIGTAQPTRPGPSGPLEDFLTVLTLVVAVVAFVFYGLIEVKNWLIGKWKDHL